MPTLKDVSRGTRVSSSPDTPPSGDSAVLEQSLEVTVVFTTVPGTLAALKEASRMAHALKAQIRILVPQVVSYALPVERPPVDPLFKIRKLWTVFGADHLETRIDVRLCRDTRACLKQALSPKSIVMVGGRKRWWPTREKRLAKSLSLAGNHVTFVPTR
jgi:hypothetical protein